MPPGPRGTSVVAWRPPVAGVAEVLHATFTDHAYPLHTHQAGTLLLVDDGVVRYDLDRHAHGAGGSGVTLLPPGVPHDGRATTAGGFRKRVLYLEAGTLGEERIGAAVDRPALDDAVLKTRVSQLHAVLAASPEQLEAESRLAFILERLQQHLSRGRSGPPHDASGGLLADRLRELLDARTVEGLTLAEAADLVHAHPTHLVRSFTRRNGLAPHQYLTGRRVDLARRLLLDGMTSAEVAGAAGFYDQAHLTRHFRRVLGTTPAAYSRSARYRGPGSRG